MLDVIAKCRDPLRTILVEIHTWLATTYPASIVSGPQSIDKEGWIDYGIPDGTGTVKIFAGARYRRDKPMGVTIVLASKPERDDLAWVHEDVGRLRPLGFAFGLPRPFEKSVSAESMRYVCELIAQSHNAMLKVTR